ncbi:MAG: 3'(2'),5'-bisphosphate nucleotidase [Candidatus Hydrogenedentes bacterium]|nr:3'(2'),5'-bisphosphate nucleotidase [Candidatus Hydrogenedentota bacterium]MBI3119217.1 3'(2'),5'-bisphosphate nucleotidase [Candidatus Hydrogenedentota bacterium]
MSRLSQPELQFALDAVRRAGLLAQQIQGEMVVEGVAKGDMSPVTVADYAIQALVGRALAERFPDDVLVAEESAEELRAEAGTPMRALVYSYVERATGACTEAEVYDWIDRGAAAPAERFWTLDPVDGTKGYLRGEQYAVALALIENGQVKLGVLGCPNLGGDFNGERIGSGVLSAAVRGEGAWVAVPEETILSPHMPPMQPGGPVGAAEPLQFSQLRVSPSSDAHQARILRSVEAAHTNVDEVDQIAHLLGVQAPPVRMDSQAKYAVLAAGAGEMLFRLLSPKKPDYKERIWDQAAGSIILEEAGGRITDLCGNALDFSQGQTLKRNTGVFASNGTLHDAGLQAIRQVCKI